MPGEPIEEPSSRLLLPTPGEVLDGRYLLERELARGGMGVVYAGKHILLGQRVAVKFVRPELIGNDDAVARFLNEARIAASLRSEHVARVMDVGRLPSGVPFFVMEYLEGVDLQTLLDESGPLEVDTVVDYALQTCEALGEAHAAKLVHRDIKPENLFLAKDPHGRARIQVVDFGISKRLDPSAGSLTDPTQSVGSPLYMSPEQMKNPADVDGRTDIWSLGVTMFQLLTGRPPFDAESMPQVCAKVLSEPAPSPRHFREEIPPRLEQIIMRCLEKKRRRRYSSIGALHAELLALTEPLGRGGPHVSHWSSDSEPPPCSVTDIGRTSRSRRRAPSPGRVALVGTAVTALVLAMLLGPRDGESLRRTLADWIPIPTLDERTPTTTTKLAVSRSSMEILPRYVHAKSEPQRNLGVASPPSAADAGSQDEPSERRISEKDARLRIDRLAELIRANRADPLPPREPLPLEPSPLESLPLDRPLKDINPSEF